MIGYSNRISLIRDLPNLNPTISIETFGTLESD